MKKIFLIFISVILVVLIVQQFMCINSCINAEYMDKVQPETDKHVGCVNINRFHFNGNELNLESVIEKNNSKPSTFIQAYVVKDSMVYFSYRFVNSEHENTNEYLSFVIARVNINGSGFENLCSCSFNYNEMNYSYVDLKSEFEKRTTYYESGKIIITDFSKLLEYNVLDDTYAVMDYNEYTHPEYNFYYTQIKDATDYNEGLQIDHKGNSYFISTDYLQESNNVIAQISKNFKRNIWDGCSSFIHLPYSALKIDGNIYLICNVYDFNGGAYALVFLYDLKTDESNYITYCYTWDKPELSDFYVVPRINGKQSGDGSTSESRTD